MVLVLVVSTVMPGVMAFGEDEQELSLYEVMSETTETAEVKVLSSSDDSEVEVATDSDAEIEAEEGLEVLENYTISEREKSDETLYVKAEQDEDVSLMPEESMALYSVADDKLEEVIIEDISEEENPCEIDDEVTGLALVRDLGYRHLNFKLDAVTLDGMMPKNATADASDVTDKYKLVNESSDTDASESNIVESTAPDASSSDASLTDAECSSSEEKIIAAYDITIWDGDNEYQPSKYQPIEVAITDSQIKSDSNLYIYHIKDDGEKELITDFTVEDGKVSFCAYGFSVYEIVEGPEKYTPNDQVLTSVAELLSAQNGFYLSVLWNGSEQYISNTLNANDSFVEKASALAANPWFIEEVSGEANQYYLYTYVGEEKMYVYHTSGNSNNSAGLTESNGDKFIIGVEDGRIRFTNVNNSNKCLQHSKGGQGIRYHSDVNPNGLFKAVLADSISMPDNYYDLDGKSYGLAIFLNETDAHTMTPEEDNYKKNNKVIKGIDTLDVKIKINPLTRNNINYNSEEKNVFFWTFHNVEKDDYKLSTVINGEEKYLKISADGLETVDSEQDASAFIVFPGEGARKGSIRLVSGTNAISFSTDSGGVFTRANENQSDAKQILLK